MSNSQILGFYFVVLQSQFNGYVKCWFDGENDYDYLSEEELMTKVKLLPDYYSTALKLSEALTESSFFLWDVDANLITRLTSKISRDSLRSEIKAVKDSQKVVDINQPVLNDKGKITLFNNLKNIFRR